MHKSILFKISVIIFLIFSLIGFSYGWKFIVQGYIRETFDDNINSVVETPLVKKKFDFISEAMVALGIRHEGKTDTLDIIGHVVQQVYAMNFGLTNNNQDISLNYAKSLSELLMFQVTDSFQNYPEPDRFEVLFGNTQGRMRYWRNYFNLSSIFEVNSHYLININYTNQLTKYFYTRTRRSYLNNYFSGINLNQQLKLSLMQTARMQQELHWDSANNTYVFYEYQWTKPYPAGILQVHRPGIGYRHDFTKQLYVEGRVAPDIVIPSNNKQYNLTAYNRQIIESPKKYYSLYSFLILSNDVDIKTNARLQFTYQNSILANAADTTTNWQILGDVTRYVLPRVLLTSSIFYGEGYIYSTNSTERLLGIKLSLSYEFSEHISANIYYDFTLNYKHINGNYIAYGFILNSRSLGYEKENSGYLRNRVSLGFSAEY